MAHEGRTFGAGVRALRNRSAGERGAARQFRAVGAVVSSRLRGDAIHVRRRLGERVGNQMREPEPQKRGASAAATALAGWLARGSSLPSG